MRGSAPDIGTEIADLKKMDIEDLRIRWRAVFARRTPEHLPRHLLTNMIAYELQANQFGDLSKERTRYLDSIVKSGSRAGSLPIPGHLDTEQFMVGTVFVREHAGINHHVTVVPQGFAWSGNVYSSLSAVARAMTGTNWNGKRFFGLPRHGRAAAL
jgi:hypothetical protein